MQKFDYCCRSAASCDNIEQIAKYIHLTDPYIYPKITPHPGDKAWVDLIAECLTKADNLFSLRHISVVTYGDDIVGIACTIPCGKKLTFSEGITIPQTLRNSISPVIEGYFHPLLEESYQYSGYNIVNVCIDENHRGRGVGKQLMAHCIRQYGSDTIHLDTIASNLAAVKLYTQSGFAISGQYMGYSGDDTLLPCYHMIRHIK